MGQVVHVVALIREHAAIAIEIADGGFAGDDVFVSATGVTDGSLLRGVLFTDQGAVTDSIVMRSRSGTTRRIGAVHRMHKLERI